MAVEQYANAAQTTLSGNGGTVSSGATSFTVASGSAFPASGPFRILIGSELMIVGARSGATFSSVSRPTEGTTAASHNDGDAVTHVLTAYTPQALALLNPKLALGDPTGLFTSWVNQDIATVDESAGDVLLSCATGGSTTPHCRVKSAPGSTPWNADFALIADLDPNTSAGWVAVGFRASGSGGLVLVRFQLDTGVVPTLFLDNWNSATSYSGTPSSLVFKTNFAMQQGPLYLRVRDDGTNLRAYWSMTAGRTWQLAFSETRASFLGAPNQVVIAVRDGTAIPNSLLLLGYGES